MSGAPSPSGSPFGATAARASVVRVLAVALVAAGLLAVACGDGPRVPTRPPNVVMIVMDTTRADRCSVTGYDRETTPRLAELAREATVFTRCWSPSPWTAPAHGSLFTGLRPVHHGLSQTNPVLAAEHVTLAEHLRLAGWSTACWSANRYVAPSTGLTQGFRHFDSPGERLEIQRPRAPLNHEPAAAWAIEQHQKGTRFFLFVNDMEPHAPFDPDEPFRGRFAPGLDAETSELAACRFPTGIELTVGVRKADERLLRAASDLYDAEIASLDHEIGRLLDRLEAAGALDDTLVIVCGDHGESLGEHGVVGHQFTIHRTVLHVPLILRYPAAVEAGRVVPELVRLEDVFPSVLELCRLDVPPGIDGASLLGDLGGRIARATYDHPSLAMTSARRAVADADLRPFDVGLASVYDGHHHLIRATDGREWLYDVDADPLESVNLARRLPEVADRLRGLLDE